MDMEILSTIVSVVSIVLGIYAIVQAERYNKESEKVNADTRKILNLQLEEIQTIERKIARDLIKSEDNCTFGIILLLVIFSYNLFSR